MDEIMSYPSLEEHRQQITMVDCRWCHQKEINLCPIEMDEHDNGWQVQGIAKTMWLWITCPGCDYQWALWKMGVGQKWQELREESK